MFMNSPEMFGMIKCLIKGYMRCKGWLICSVCRIYK